MKFHTWRTFCTRGRKVSQEFHEIYAFLPRIMQISTPLASDPPFFLAWCMKDIQQPEFCAIHTLLSIQNVSKFESFFLIFVGFNQLPAHLLKRKVQSRISSISCTQVTKSQN